MRFVLAHFEPGDEQQLCAVDEPRVVELAAQGGILAARAAEPPAGGKKLRQYALQLRPSAAEHAELDAGAAVKGFVAQQEHSKAALFIRRRSKAQSGFIGDDKDIRRVQDQRALKARALWDAGDSGNEPAHPGCAHGFCKRLSRAGDHHAVFARALAHVHTPLSGEV